jgi:UDP-N-acetylglucosamine--N-acetylmuramyl-(pentapeptide) pyrophosphoryl-undecaprenol N-acetylglucosamine transferase
LSKSNLFVMAGGGTGGHVIPGIAVARELRRMGQEVLFVGTERGVESRMVPAEGFRLEKIRVGGIKNLGIMTRVASLWRLVTETVGQIAKFGEWKPAAVFSMGGYVAGPPVLAAVIRGVPLVVMEPNAMPGVTNRYVARWVNRALISFEEAAKYFPKGRTELTGRPVGEEFFRIQPKTEGSFTILITGGSQGSRTLNEAARQSWPLFQAAGVPIRFIHQAGSRMFESVAADFQKTGLAGEVKEFITDMPAGFAQADLIVCRSGGTVAEVAAAGKPSIMVPLPTAADDHQRRNAEAFELAGAARLSLDRDWTGQRFFDWVMELYQDRAKLLEMGERARKLARPGAARRAAEILVEIGQNRAKD